MINRNTLKCDSCGAEITVRVSFGLGSTQIHPFNCPKCEIEIVVTVDIDQDAAAWKYRDPVNAKYLEAHGIEDAEFVKTFDSDNLLLRDTKGMPAFPFVMNSHNAPDPLEAHRAEAIRRDGYKNAWPILRRLRIHFDNRAITLFDKEILALGKDLSGTIWQARVSTFCAITENYFVDFLPKNGAARKLASDTVDAAAKASRDKVIEYCQQCVSSGYARRLWNQLWEVRELYMRHYPLFNPLLKFAGWRSGFKLSDYYLSEKRFEEIRPLYANAFETLSKLSTLAIAFELLSKSQPLAIPTRKGSMTLEEYDSLANGSKPDHLSKFGVAPMFIPYMDNHLRNGIGHNSAHYVIKDDAVWYRSSRGEKVVEESIDYAEFAHRTLHIVGAVEAAAIFLNSVMFVGQRVTSGIMDV